MSKHQTNAVTQWLLNRIQSGGVAGPYKEKELSFPVHTVPIFTVPKPEMNKYRIIQIFHTNLVII